MNKKITLEEAVRFHGHLGPYLVLGVLAGELALKKLKSKKYFDLNVRVTGADKKPQSCLVDGLQLSTGATYGKGNITKLDGSVIKIEIKDKNSSKKVKFWLKKSLLDKLAQVKTHRDSTKLAKRLYRTRHTKLFNLK